MKLRSKLNIIIIVFMIIVIFYPSIVSAAAPTFWTKATSFFNGGKATKTSLGAIDDLKGIIQGIGNTIIVGVTVILGVKYIWGSVESKASVKESLITLVIAATAFYSWTTIETLFVSGGKFIYLADSPEATANKIYNVIMYICNFAAIGGIVYIGVRYLLAGATGRAELKTKSVILILGIIMVYSTITFLKIATSVV